MTRALPTRQSIHVDADDADKKLEQWQGHKRIGWEMVKAKQHSEWLYRTYRKGAASVVYNIVGEIFEVGSDPVTNPDDDRILSAWAKLPAAIDAANEACEHIMRTYSPYDSKAMQAFWYAENLYFSLTGAEFLAESLNS